MCSLQSLKCALNWKTQNFEKSGKFSSIYENFFIILQRKTLTNKQMIDTSLIIYVIVAFVNVFLHIIRSILVIKSTKFWASLANCICYTFSAIVIKFIAETDLWIAIAVQASTNFVGTWAAMRVYEKIEQRWKKK